GARIKGVFHACRSQSGEIAVARLDDWCGPNDEGTPPPSGFVHALALERPLIPGTDPCTTSACAHSSQTSASADPSSAAQPPRLLSTRTTAVRTRCEDKPVHMRARAGHDSSSDPPGLRGFRARDEPPVPALPSRVREW